MPWHTTIERKTKTKTTTILQTQKRFVVWKTTRPCRAIRGPLQTHTPLVERQVLERTTRKKMMKTTTTTTTTRMWSTKWTTNWLPY